MHVDRAGPIIHFRHHIKRIEDKVVMAQHHAFRPPGGPPGIEQSGKLAPSFADIPHRIGFSDKRLIVDTTVR